MIRYNFKSFSINAVAFITVLLILFLFSLKKEPKIIIGYDNACNTCAPIPIPNPIAGEKIDTLKGQYDYRSVFSFENGILSSKAILGDEFGFQIGKDKIYLNHIYTLDEDAIRKEDSIMAVKRDSIAKIDFRQRPPSGSMMPRNYTTSVVVADFNTGSGSLKSFHINYVKYLSLIRSSDSSILETNNYIKSKSLSIVGLHFNNSSFNITNQIFNIYSCNFSGKIDLSGSSDSVTISNTRFGKLNDQLSCRELKITDCKIDSNSTIKAIANCFLKNITGKGIIEFTGPDYDIGDIKNQAILYNFTLNDLDFNHIKFPEYNVNFVVDTAQKYPKQLKLYNQLIHHYQDIPEEKEKYDIRYQKLLNKKGNHWLVDFFEEQWNNYGYNKNLIFLNSLIIMMVFFLINLYLYPKILTDGYTIEEFKNADDKLIKDFNHHRSHWKKDLRNAFYCFFYTGFIFWGFKLDIEKIKISNILISFWIIFQFSIGIVCLLNIANIIITK